MCVQPSDWVDGGVADSQANKRRNRRQESGRRKPATPSQDRHSRAGVLWLQPRRGDYPAGLLTPDVLITDSGSITYVCIFAVLDSNPQSPPQQDRDFRHQEIGNQSVDSCELQIQDAIESMDEQHLCEQYWQGKADRMNHAAGMPVNTANRPPRTQPAGRAKPRRRKNR
jgi:hypothetical protein